MTEIDPRELLDGISARFAELRAELERTRTELDGVKRRLTAYENFDGGLREAVSSALAKTYDELEPKLLAAREELQRAEAARGELAGEIARLREMRDGLQQTVESLRPTAGDLRRGSSETLRALMQDVRSEMRDELTAFATPAVPPTSAPPIPGALPVVEPVVASPAGPSWPTYVSTPSRSERQIELVLHAVRSFPQLLAIESRIQSFPGVSRVFAQRAGEGLARLTVHLDDVTDRDDFVATLERSDRPQLLVESVSGDLVQVRIAEPT